MTEFLLDYGLFLLKLITVVSLLGALLVVFLGLGSGALGRMAGKSRGRLKVRHLNREYDQATHAIEHAQESDGLRSLIAQLRGHIKRDKTEKQARRIYVLDFKGDLRASAVESLREEITALLALPDAPDEVVVRLESPGGLVPGYGLAAAQLRRVRERDIDLTVCVDTMAASGGYMMACVANRILAAPFAILGSIGVIAPVPNFHRALEKRDIDYEEFKAGQYKRTVSLLGENTEEGREKFQSDIEDLHALFKEFVKDNRPAIDLDKVATGEYWYGSRALAMNLADELKTSDDYLLEASREAAIFHLHWEPRRTLTQKLLDEPLSRLSLYAGSGGMASRLVGPGTRRIG